MDSEKRTVVVEGKIIIDDDESSDDDSDEPVASRDSAIVYEKFNCDGDDDELEVFGNDIEPYLASNSLSLVDAMSAAVNHVQSAEQFGFDFNEGLSTTIADAGSKQVQSSLMKTKASSIPAAACNDEGDIFGIAYKPYGKKKKEYDTPTGPSFEDEHEFEKDLKTSAFSHALSGTTAGDNGTSITTNDEEEEDDEFGFSDSVNSQIPHPDAEGVAAVQKALQRAAERAKDEAAAVLAAVSAPVPIVDLSVPSSEKEPEAISGKDFLATSRAAVAELTGKYKASPGGAPPDLSDGVLLHGLKSLSEAQRLAQPGAERGYVPSIAETDEDEEDNELQREQTRRQQQQDAESQRDEERHRLEQEWGALEDPPSPPTDTTTTAPAVSRPAGVVVDPARISYARAETFFRSTDLSRFADAIVVEDPESSSRWRLFGGPVKLKFRGWEEERRLPFLIAQVDYDPDEPAHLHMLQTIFKLLEGSGRSCPVQGPHWVQIGFQGRDPRTDLNRSMKMLSVLQLLHLVDVDGPLARRLHTLSNITPDPGRGSAAVDLSWPLFCVSLQFTKESLQAFRAGSLNKLCNSMEKVLPALHAMHRALFLDFARRLSSSPTVHHAEHLAAIRKQCATDPLVILKAAEKAKSEAFPAPAPATFDSLDSLERLQQSQENGAAGAGAPLPAKASKFLA